MGLQSAASDTPRGSLFIAAPIDKRNPERSASMAFLRRIALALVAAAAAAQDQAAPEAADEKPAPIVCPVRAREQACKLAICYVRTVQYDVYTSSYELRLRV